MKKLLVLGFATFLIVASSVSAQEVDILWQGNTYTPPFYKGRSLWTNQAQITLMGVLSFPGSGNAANYIYKWSRDNVVLGGSRGVNGVGNNSFSFTDKISGKARLINLEILAGDGAPLANSTIVVKPTQPNLLIYENNPLYGLLLNNALESDYSFSGRETTLTAVPLFFSAETIDEPVIDYTWRTGGDSLEKKSTVTYRTIDDTSGSSRVSVQVKNVNKFLQRAAANITVSFGSRE